MGGDPAPPMGIRIPIGKRFPSWLSPFLGRCSFASGRFAGRMIETVLLHMSRERRRASVRFRLGEFRFGRVWGGMSSRVGSRTRFDHCTFGLRDAVSVLLM